MARRLCWRGGAPPTGRVSAQGVVTIPWFPLAAGARRGHNQGKATPVSDVRGAPATSAATQRAAAPPRAWRCVDGAEPGGRNGRNPAGDRCEDRAEGASVVSASAGDRQPPDRAGRADAEPAR